jgi:hypothetical protein
MVREQVSLLAAAWGLVGVVFPPGIIEVFSLPPIQSMGAVYLLAGGLVAVNGYADQPNRSWNVLTVVLACAGGLWIVPPGSGLRFFAPALCILFPFAVGTADSMESMGLSTVAVFLLIAVGMIAYDPPSWNDMGDLTVAFIAGQWAVFGIPLYFVGREWQGRVPNADDRSSNAEDSGGVSDIRPDATPTVSKESAKEDGVDTERVISAGVMGTIVGGVVAFASMGVGWEPIWFAITLAGVGYFLYSTQETVKLVVGMGLYTTALCLPFVPFVLYVPGLVGLWNANSIDVLALTAIWVPIYAFGGTIVGLMLASIGYVIRNGERE